LHIFGELPVIRNYRWIGVIALTLAGGSAEAQPFYGGGYWGGGGGYGGAGSTVQGSELQGAGIAAMGMGRYNLETSQAMSINSDTAMRWNQYMYNASVESNRIYNEKTHRERAKGKADHKAIGDRLRNNPTSVDIADGSALNRAMEELADPKVFSKAVYYGGKTKLGGETIRNIPFQYASAGITTSVHDLTHGGAPAAMKKRDEFIPYRTKLQALAAEIRKEGEETGTPKPETIKQAKAEILALKAKVEEVFPTNNQDRRDCLNFVKALYGLASMLETPAIGVLLAGVEKRPDATVGDLLGFMSAYNLRFGAAESLDQRQVYQKLYPIIAKLRDEVSSVAGPTTSKPSGPVDSAPVEVFGSLDFNHAEKKVPAPPAPK
jgi:hypothetical protein